MQEHADNYRIAPRSFFAESWKMSTGFMVVGLVGMWSGYRAAPERFAFSYLFSFWTVLTLALGSLFFVLIQHVTGAAWSVSVRRISETVSTALVTAGLLFVPVLLQMKTLFPWYHGAHGVSHHGLTPDEAAHHAIVAAKSGYLNTRFFVIRALVYFVVWGALSVYFFRKSAEQDQNSDVRISAKLERLSPLSLFLLGFTVTFAGFDWIMSLEPAWYSTIFGVSIFASSMVSALALNIVMTMSLQKDGKMMHAVGIDHFHDLAKLLFGFIVFWAYISFSQLLLIWYAGIPEETTYYHLRWKASSWRVYSIFLLVGHFLVPFLFLLSRNIKRSQALLKAAALWMLIMHVVFMYWLIMPYHQELGVTQFRFHLLDLACLMFVGGLASTWVFWQLKRVALIPLGDPRLQRSLEFHGT